MDSVNRKPGIMFFGGKGGTGKTTLAAASAVKRAVEGNVVLLVSTDPAHNLSDLFGVYIGSRIARVDGSLYAMELDPQQACREYIDEVKQNISAQVKPRLLDEVHRQVDLMAVSPGAEESALFDRISRLLLDEAGRYDFVLFDTAPTGHTLRLMTLPEMMSLWVDGLLGRRKAFTREYSSLLSDAPEYGEVPGRENAVWNESEGEAEGESADEREKNEGGAEESASEKRKHTGRQHGVASDASGGAGSNRQEDPMLQVLNRRKERFSRVRSMLTDKKRTVFHFVVNPERLSIEESERAIELLKKHRIPCGKVFINKVLTAEGEGAFLEHRKQQQREYMEEIEKRFKRYSRVLIPLRERDVTTREELQEIGELLQ